MGAALLNSTLAASLLWGRMLHSAFCHLHRLPPLVAARATRVKPILLLDASICLQCLYSSFLAFFVVSFFIVSFGIVSCVIVGRLTVIQPLGSRLDLYDRVSMLCENLISSFYCVIKANDSFI